ncbi:hypothetical protein [Cognatishimia sp.]|uniref:hypothetical protein n=1 Tax=Cognatishimia sp. TaxID=2211648 RepID=UPI00351508B9|nr:hypothetical protein [Cognatishimia sp.]
MGSYNPILDDSIRRSKNEVLDAINNLDLGGSADPSNALTQLDFNSAVDFTEGDNAYLNQDGNVYPYIEDQSPAFNVTPPVTNGNEGTFNINGAMHKLSNGNVVFVDIAYTGPGNSARFHIYDEDLNFIATRTVAVSNMSQGFIPSGKAQRIIQDGSNANRLFVQTGDTSSYETRIWTFEYNPTGDLFTCPNTSGYLVTTQSGTIAYYNTLMYDTNNNKVVSVAQTSSGDHTIFTLTYSGSGNFTQNGTDTVNNLMPSGLETRPFATAYHNNSIVWFFHGESTSAITYRWDWDGSKYSNAVGGSCDFRVASGQTVFAEIIQDNLMVGVRSFGSFNQYNTGLSIPAQGFYIFSINNILTGSARTLQDTIHMSGVSGAYNVPATDKVANTITIAGLNKVIKYDIDASGNFTVNTITDITRLVDEEALDIQDNISPYGVPSGVHELGTKTYVVYGDSNYNGNPIIADRYILLDIDFLSLPFDAAPTGNSRLIGTYNATGVAGNATIDLLDQYKGETSSKDTTGFNPGDLDSDGDLIIATGSVLSKTVPANQVNTVDNTVSFTFNADFPVGRVGTTGDELAITPEGKVSFGKQVNSVSGYNTSGFSDGFVMRLKSGRYLVLNNNESTSTSKYYSILEPDFTTVLSPTTLTGGQWDDQRYMSGNKILKHPDRDAFFYLGYSTGGSTSLSLRLAYRNNTTTESFSNQELMQVFKNTSTDGHTFIDFDIDKDNRCLVVYYSMRAYNELRVRTYDLDSFIMRGEVFLTSTGQSTSYMNIANIAIDQVNKVAYTVITNGTNANGTQVRMAKIAYDPATSAYTDIIDQDLVSTSRNMQNNDPSQRVHNFSTVIGDYFIFNLMYNTTFNVQFTAINISGTLLPSGTGNSFLYMNESAMSTNARLARPVHDVSTNRIYWTDDGSSADNEIDFSEFNPSTGVFGSAQELVNLNEIAPFFSGANNGTNVSHTALNIVENEFWLTAIEIGSGSSLNNLLIGRGADSVGSTIAGTLLSTAVETQPVSCLLSSSNRGRLIAKEAEATPGQKDVNGLLVLTPSFSILSQVDTSIVKVRYGNQVFVSTSLVTVLNITNSSSPGKLLGFYISSGSSNGPDIDELLITRDSEPEEDIVQSGSITLFNTGTSGSSGYNRGPFYPFPYSFARDLLVRLRFDTSSIAVIPVWEVYE